MHCPALNEIPPPPEDKNGWPWTDESNYQKIDSTNNTYLPKISIVTPSYNQADFIEETIRSILLQGYPVLEFIIIDGSSTDGTIEIIKKYEKWISFWKSETDKGQSNALNKGFQKASGDIIGWLNSDDVYCKNAINSVTKSFLSNKLPDIVYGDGYIINNQSHILRVRKGLPISSNFDLSIFFPNPIVQSSLFFKKSVFSKVGLLDENLHYVMDIDLWIKAFRIAKMDYLPLPLSKHRFHFNSKTKSHDLMFWPEKLLLVSRYQGSQKLFEHLMAQYIYLVSLDRNVTCSVTMDHILIELAKGQIEDSYISKSIQNKNLIIANAILWQIDHFYNILDLKMARKLLISCYHQFPRFIRNKRFWKLVLRLFLPNKAIRLLRTLTRNSIS